MKTSPLQSKSVAQIPDPMTYLRSRAQDLSRRSANIQAEKTKWQERFPDMKAASKNLNLNEFCLSQGDLTRTRDEVIAQFFRRDFSNLGTSGFVGLPLERAAPVYFPPRAALETVKAKCLHSAPVFAGAGLIGSLASAEGLMGNGALAAGLVIGGCALVGSGAGILEFLTMMGLSSMGTPASYNMRTQTIVFYSQPHRVVAAGMIAHEMTHHFQNLNRELSASLDVSKYETALREGPAVGYEHHVLQELEQSEQDTVDEPGSLYPLLRGSRLEDQSRLLDMAAEFIRRDQAGIEAQVFDPDLNHALGYAAFYLGQEEHGLEIYRQALQGNYEFMTEGL